MRKGFGFLVLGIVLTVALAGCQGPPGPPGPPGEAGPPGPSGAASEAAAMPDGEMMMMPPASLRADPSSIESGKRTQMSFIGAGFTPNTPVTVSLRMGETDLVAGGGSANESGAFSISYDAQREERTPVLEPGVYGLFAEDTKGVMAVAAITVEKPKEESASP